MDNLISQHNLIGRRSFIKSSAASFALSVLGPYALDITHRSKPWRVALIGCGWYGQHNLFRLLQVANIEIAGLCDVDRHQVEKLAISYMGFTGKEKAPPVYENYQQMITQENPEIVIIATPDHWHALQAIDCIRSGAHIYLESPTTMDILEGEAILRTAKRYRRVVQVGLQRRNTSHLIEAKKTIVDEGLLGKISHVEMCCYYPMRANAAPPVQRVPEFLDYDLWTGPAQLRPFDRIPHRGWWRAFMQYGNGIMGDMGVHMLDTVRWMLNLGWPEHVYSSGGIYVQKDSKATIPDTQTAIFKYDELECIWRHRSWGKAPDEDYPWAFTIFGEKGLLKASVFKYEFNSYDGKQKIQNEALTEKDKYPEDLAEEHLGLHMAPATRRHMLDFLSAITADTKNAANLMEGHISSASCILANISMSVGQAVIYDQKQKLITNNPEADKLLQRPYREPWLHPYGQW